MTHRRPLACALFAWLALVCSASGANASSDTAAHFIGSATCTACHSAQAAAWQGSHHAQAMQAADGHTVLGDFTRAMPPGLDVQRFFRRDDRFFARVQLPGHPPQDVQIRYTFGVYPLQQYLVEWTGGRLQALNTAWDARPAAQGGQHWFALRPVNLAPSDPLHWTGRDSNWNFMCAACHTTNLVRNYSIGSDSYRTTWSETGVGCESCHGPGSRHVNWARDPRHAAASKGLEVTLHAGRDVQWGFWSAAQRIASPHGTLAVASQQAEVCFPCHSRRQALSDGAPPARPLLENYVPQLIEPGLYHPDGQIEAEDFEFGSFVQSRMYGSGVTCTNCHDAHTLQLKASGNATCTQCHRANVYDVATHHHHRQDSEAARCISCHMPTKTYMGVDRRRDHSFRLPAPALTVATGAPNACNQCHADRTAAWAVAALKSWPAHDAAALHFAPAFDDAWSGATATAGLLQVFAQPWAPIVRATALSLLSASPAPTPESVSVALVKGASDPNALVRLGAARGLAALEPDAALKTGAALLVDPLKAVRIEAARSLAGADGAAATEQVRNRLDNAAQELIAAELSSPERPESHVNVAQIQLRLGQPVQAERELQAALRLDAHYVPAMVNLADLYRGQQREADAARWLRQAVSVAPSAAEPAHALGLLEVRAGHAAAALNWLRKAVTLDPANARYSYVYAVALAEAGRGPEAIQVVRAARTRAPKDDSLRALEQQLGR